MFARVPRRHGPRWHSARRSACCFGAESTSSTRLSFHASRSVVSGHQLGGDQDQELVPQLKRPLSHFVPTVREWDRAHRKKLPSMVRGRVCWVRSSRVPPSRTATSKRAAESSVLPGNNCYVKIPVPLGWQPCSGACTRECALLATFFAGSDGFKALMVMNSLVFGREQLPDIILMSVGYGMDGKSLTCSDLMSAVWGSAFGNCPGTMLQIPREFQQGHNFIDATWVTFDEADRQHSVEEAILKMFVVGVTMPLRRNHEADTHYHLYSQTGKAWCFNIGDIPEMPTATETSQARRIRCIFHCSEFTAEVSGVDSELRVFVANPLRNDQWKLTLMRLHRRLKSCGGSATHGLLQVWTRCWS